MTVESYNCHVPHFCNRSDVFTMNVKPNISHLIIAMSSIKMPKMNGVLKNYLGLSQSFHSYLPTMLHFCSANRETGERTC